MALTVNEASAAYQQAMRNIATPAPDICSVCSTFIDPAYGAECIACSRQPNHLSVVVPITYSEHLGQMHTALRTYKEAEYEPVRRYAFVRLTGVLWRFLRDHEACVATAAGVGSFDLVTCVPSSTSQRDEASALRSLVRGCAPVADRFERLLEPTGAVASDDRHYNPNRYRPRRDLEGESVLIIDDTWASGGHAQSAAAMLDAHGAGVLALAVIGRHLRRAWEPVRDSGVTTGDRLDALPKQFDWDTCAVHDGS
jgi:predicted amidophosphoribosyltransferase